MKTCHVCGYVCEENEELCPKCGAALIDDEAENEKVVEEINKPVLLATVNDPVTAEILGDVLLDNGIAYIFGEQNGAMHIGFGGGFIAIDVYVDEENLDDAQKIYEDVLNSEEADEETEAPESTEEI